jgi:hypothetical protein
MKVQSVSKGVEEGKQRVELEGLSPDELIRARTGYTGMQDVRQSIVEEIAKGNTMSPSGVMLESTSQRVMRPLTADSNSLKRASTPQKKFKMLKELARLNQELRVQKPYNPTTKD